MIAKLHPKKWQLGTVFVPDSLGYFIGTCCFGEFSYRVGQVKMSVFAIMIIGCSCVLIPEAKSVLSLIIPHFFLGLCIGVLDSSLVPFLAHLADSGIIAAPELSPNDNSASSYGSVYAIQQTAVSLAYSVVPFLAGESVQSMGFPFIMRFLGVLNFLYGPTLLYVTVKYNQRVNYMKACITVWHLIIFVFFPGFSIKTSRHFAERGSFELPKIL